MKRLSVLALSLLVPALAATSIPAKESRNLAVARQLNEAFVEVAAKVSPTVVILNVVQKVYGPPLEDGTEDGRFDSLPPGFWRKFHQEFQRETPERT